LSWNIRQGGGTRTRSIIKSLIQRGSSVIVLSEYRNNNNGRLIRNELLKADYLFQYAGHSPKNVNSVFIGSKIPCDFSQFPNADKNYPGNLISAKFELFELYGMYLPHKEKHLWFDFLNTVNDPSIMVGDMNSGINGLDQKGASFWYEKDLIELHDKGIIDAFRLIHRSKKEYSWYSHQGNGYRYDHSLVHRSLKSVVKDCFYIHDWREGGLSDHSPMVLQLS